MRVFIKNAMKKLMLGHRISHIEIEDNRKLKVMFDQLSHLSGKTYLVLKDKATGRRLQSEIQGNKAYINLNELHEMADAGKMDFYLKSYLFNRTLQTRIAHNHDVPLFEHIDEERKKKLRFYKTIRNNLSLMTEKTSFRCTLQEIKPMGNNFYLAGEVEPLEEMKPATVEMVLVRRDTRQGFGYKFELKKKPGSGNMYTFNGMIFIEKLRSALAMNSRWDVFFQLRDDKNNLIHREIMNTQGFRSYEREEYRYLETAQLNDEHVAVLYATMGKNSLALWYTDKNQYARTFQIAKGKSIFNEVCEREKLNTRMVFFESFLGKNYSGNPKYIYEEMIQNSRFKDYIFVWSYSGPNPECIPGNPIIVNRSSEEYYKFLARAKYWVSNIILPIHRKREGNVYLQTWHGTPLKKLGFDIEIEGPETLARENFYIESRNWDYLVAANKYSSDIFKRAFKFDKKVLEAGYPANDIFYQGDTSSKAQRLKEKLLIPASKKVILYAPTWRDNEMANSWDHTFTLPFNLGDMYQRLGEDYVLVLRMHHLVSEMLEIDPKYKGFVYDFSKYDDIQELYTLSDLLITDYSSVFFDYANSRKPILFFAYDFESYRDNIRGFYLDMARDLPGPIIRTSDDLLDAIENIDSVSAQYAQKYEDFYKEYCSLEEGNAAKTIAELVFK
ncbi:CDP-glycerol glycerophosphotransferase family protein [Fictibacillus sp. NRS-1165]|uniref:CDP-glycerol glycerophosphotransferase family protein n=1 Tax=Fictibacillus sp. NRS-1165 TaxID=3144463 RepID=UPI003D1BDB1A